MWINGRARARVVSVQRGKREVFCPLLPFNTHFTLTFYRSFFHFVKYHKFHPNCTNLSPYTFKIRKKEKKNKTRNQRHFFCVCILFIQIPFYSSFSTSLFQCISFPFYPFLIYSIEIPACYSSSILDSFQLLLVFYRLHSVKNFF